MTEAIVGPGPFLIGGGVILLVGFLVLARGRAPRPGLSFFQVSVALALYVVVAGTLLDPGRSAEALRSSGDLELLLGLLLATTLFQFATYGLGFGPSPAAPRERRQGVILMWAVSAAVGLLLAAGEISVVGTVGAPVAGEPLLGLRWEAIPLAAATAAGLAGGCRAAYRSWRESPQAVRTRRAGWSLAGLVLVSVLPVTLHLPAWHPLVPGTGLVAAAAGTLVLASIARLEPVGMELLSPVASAVLQSVHGPALTVNRDGLVETSNDAFLRTFGFEPEEVAGRPLTELVEDRTGSRLPLTELSLDDDERGREVWVRSDEDEDRRARVVACALGHLEGDGLPSLYLFRPGLRHRRSDEDVGVVDRAVREHFRAGVPAVAVVDPDDGRFLHVNDQFLQLTGHARGELVGHRPEELELLAGRRAWARLLRDAGRGKGVERREGRIRREGGEDQHAELFATRISSDEGDRVLVLALDVTARKRVEEELRGEVLYDSLTGLPNRILFREQIRHALERAQRLRHRVGILFIDLADFREVNEDHGEAVGDQILAGVAWRLYECFRQMDTLGRRGGDEFLVLLEELDDTEGAAAAADRFRRHLEEPFRLEGGVEVRMEANVGVAVSVPGQSEPDDLLRWADAALFRAKRRQGSAIHVFDPERDAGEMEQLSRADELRKAIERNELTLLYQPLISLADGRIVGSEALVRWPGEDGELRSPDEFLPLAEETGLIVPMSDWILEEAARQGTAWRDRVPDFKISVNVAAQHFREPELRDTLEELLAGSDLPPQALQLEITESAALRDTRAIERLRELGIRITVDDFGTGYSSLQYIRGLGVDGVKIDQVFVSSVDEDEKDQAVVRAVLLMAEAFELQVTAEGIETAEQLRWLRQAKCHLGQGYYFSRPVPADEFTALLEAKEEEGEKEQEEDEPGSELPSPGWADPPPGS